MEKLFQETLDKAQREGVELLVERLGERPCAAFVDPRRKKAMLDRAFCAVEAGCGRKAYCRSGSTDCNIPLSLGIPSLCLAACEGQLWHTREERLELASLLPGCRTVLHYLYDAQ